MVETVTKRRRREGVDTSDRVVEASNEESMRGDGTSTAPTVVDGKNDSIQHPPLPPSSFSPPSSTTTTAAAPPRLSTTCCTVYIGGLDPRVAQVHLEKLLQPYGSIRRLSLCRTAAASAQQPQQNRPFFAFCEYAHVHEAQAAMQALHRRTLLGKTLVVQPAKERTGAGALSCTARRSSSSNNNTTQQSLGKQKQAIEMKIQALKRKLQEREAHS